MIKQSSAGIYTWLPLFKSVKNIETVRDEQNKAGAIELMPTIQSADLWINQEGTMSRKENA